MSCSGRLAVHILAADNLQRYQCVYGERTQARNVNPAIVGELQIIRG